MAGVNHILKASEEDWSRAAKLVEAAQDRQALGKLESEAQRVADRIRVMKAEKAEIHAERAALAEELAAVEAWRLEKARAREWLDVVDRSQLHAAG